jgi:PqqD family protein of HPr-rel-A system
MNTSYQVAHDQAAWSESGEGLVVLDLRDSNYLSLNGTAAALWRRLADGPASATELESVLLADYDVQADRARDDVANFLGHLVERGLVAQHAAL